MYYCTDRLSEVLSDSTYDHAHIFNLHGGKGVGKSCMVAQLMDDRRQSGSPCGYLDFEEYRGLSAHATLNALYQICDYLTVKHGIPLPQFEIADEVSSERWGRIPYLQRKKEVVSSAIDRASELSGLVVDMISEFRDLPYVGMGINLIQRASKLAYSIYCLRSPVHQAYRSLRESCQKMSDSELLRQLPLYLAKDVEHSVQESAPGHPILMVVDNYTESQIDYGWIETLIENTRHVTWLFVSRKPITCANQSIVSLPVSPLGKEQMKRYLQKTQRPWTEELIDVLMRTSAGNPLRIERILEYAAQHGGYEHIDWAQLESIGYRSIALESLNSLSVGEKEILFQLNFANRFDADLFSRMFPDRLFSLYRSLFCSSLFSTVESGRYQVHTALKEEIADYMRQLDERLEQTCRENLYRAEYTWFQELDASAQWSLSQCDDHLRNLLAYGQELGSADRYARDLMHLKRILLELGYATEYCHALSCLVDSASTSVRIAIYREIAITCLGISRFEESRQAIHQGLALLTPQDAEEQITFSFILMELEYISPSDQQDAVQHCVEIAEHLVEILRANMIKMPLQHYIKSTTKAHLYLSKAYIVKNEYDTAMTHAKRVLDICADTELRSILALYASHAKALEYMGEIYSMQGKHDDALSCYQSAAKNYGLAEVVQRYWDASFCLNMGLTYVRISEACLALAQKQTQPDQRDHLEAEALSNIDRAMTKYGEVCSKNLGLIDAYCKIGFACTTLLEYFWDKPKYRQNVEQCFDKAHSNLCSALQLIGDGSANRQLANIGCTVYRLEGCFLASLHQNEAAEKAFQQGITWGHTAVSAAPRHPYGYLVLSECCQALGNFLAEQGRIQEKEQILQEGLRQIRTAKSYAGNTNRHFQSIEDGILSLLQD